MAPPLSTVYRRRWWLATTSVLENLMFAAVLLGWSSLLLMLKNEGYYAHLCHVGNETASPADNETSTEATPPSLFSMTASTEEAHDEDGHHVNTKDNSVRFTPSGFPTCAEQDELLNRYFSIGSSLLSGVTIILGVIMDKYGSRMIRLCGTLAFMLSCVLFAIGSMDTQNLSILIAPAVCLNGMGGVVYIFTSFPIPNLFKNLRSTMIALMIGSYSASAIMYMLFKAAYDAGVPFVTIMIFHAAIGFFTFLNCYFNTPGEPIPGPDDICYAIKLQFGDFRFEHKVSGKKFLQLTSNVGRRMSSTETTKADNHNYLTSFVDIKDDNVPSQEKENFLRVIITPCVIWSFVTICITQLRLIAYMGWLELYFRSACHHKGFDQEKTNETIEFYTFIFGLLQVNCFFMAPVIGTIMDWNLKPKKKSKAEKKGLIAEIKENGSVEAQINNALEHKENGNAAGSNTNQANVKSEGKKKLSSSAQMLKRKKQQLSNLIRAFLITNILQVIFGIIIQFEGSLEIQVLAFILHTVIRTFLHSSMGSLYACMYHFSHFGKLTGVSSFFSAMFILIADPLFVLINSSFGGDPFWINFALLICSLFGFGLPGYLFYYRRTMKYSKEEEGESKRLFTINEEDEEKASDESSSSDDEPAPYVSSLALAL